MPGTLRLDQLTVSYGGVTAARDCDLVAPCGRVVALLGPNGAGKSSLMNAIAGLVPAESGAITLDDVDLTPMPAFARSDRGVCLIPEGRGIFRSLSVADNLRLMLDNDQSLITSAYELFPALGIRKRQAGGTLSGGEQQMLALSKALRKGVRILLADELSLGLAPMLVQRVSGALQQLHETCGLTVLMVEQYAQQALRLADIVYLMRQGEIMWAGEPNELLGSDTLRASYFS